MPRQLHDEHHRSERIGWLRATVLGANDGIVSIASLIVGVAAANASRSEALTAGSAGLVAGALSMAVGEYVSVSSQRDTELADIATEQRELTTDPDSELIELTSIYERRGLDHALATEVAQQLTEHDALAAHARDELGITATAAARPQQAAGSSAASFLVGGGLPLIAAIVASSDARPWVVSVVAVICLALLGAMGARLGGASKRTAAVRIAVLGALALGASAAIGAAVGTVV